MLVDEGDECVNRGGSSRLVQADEVEVGDGHGEKMLEIQVNLSNEEEYRIISDNDCEMVKSSKTRCGRQKA